MNGAAGLVVTAADEAALEALARQLARQISDPSSWVIFLRGPIGAGKTTFVRYLFRAFGVDDTIRSPTYTLLEPYTAGRFKLFHLDLYRLAGPEELEYLGVRDLLAEAALWCVEWPDKGRGELPSPDLEIDIEPVGEYRRLQLVPCTSRARQALAPMGDDEPA